jgi:hypothetical protein
MNCELTQLTEMPPHPKGYRRNKVTKAQREEFLEQSRQRYRERKAQQLAKELEEKNKTPASN